MPQWSLKPRIQQSCRLASYSSSRIYPSRCPNISSSWYRVPAPRHHGRFPGRSNMPMRHTTLERKLLTSVTYPTYPTADGIATA